MLKKKNLLLFLILFLSVFSGVFVGYVSDSYTPEPPLSSQYVSHSIEKEDQKNHFLALLPKQSSSEAAVVFYQGAKVEAEAYIPLMEKLVEKGISVYLLKLPFNLAVFSPNAAQKVIQQNPHVQDWYLAGHSLGGVMAASYVSKHPERIRGMIFLASYPSGNMNGVSLPVLSIYGDQDQILNQETYRKQMDSLPNVEEVIIRGGNHAQFGSYGPQKGDGHPFISEMEQQRQTAEAILDFIHSSSSR